MIPIRIPHSFRTTRSNLFLHNQNCFYFSSFRLRHACSSSTTTTLTTHSSNDDPNSRSKSLSPSHQIPNSTTSSKTTDTTTTTTTTKKKPNGYWANPVNQRKFFDEAAQRLGLKSLDDWYNVTKEDLIKPEIGGLSLLNRGRSHIRLLATLYPEHEWLPWKFRNVPQGFWHDVANQRRFLDWIAKQIGVRQMPDDWYRVNFEDVKKYGAAGLLDRHYKGSLAQALATVYPEHEWLPWKFQWAPQRFWRDKRNHRRFFDWAGQQLGLYQQGQPQQPHEFDQWYTVSARDIVRLNGGSLLGDYYQGSLAQALAAVYPEHEWLPWRFQPKPAGLWNDVKNHRQFFEWVGQQLGVRELDDWYNVTGDAVRRLGGARLLAAHYNDSFVKALETLYPQHAWMPWRFTVAPHGVWESKENQRAFLDWAAKQLNIGVNSSSSSSSSSYEGWYSVSADDIVRLGGSRLLELYNRSFVTMLTSVYPEHPWEPWRFQHHRLAQNQEDFVRVVDDDALRRYVEMLASRFQVQCLDDWYRVPVSKLRSDVEGYRSIVRRYGGLIAVLKRVYPEHNWDEQRMLKQQRGKRSSQRWLKVAVQRLFPGEVVFEEYTHSDMRFAEHNASITTDIWVPSLALALEYQGAQHYRDIYVLGSNPAKQKQRDQEKLDACTRAGITLVVVPYWWYDNNSTSTNGSNRRSKSGGSVEDLAATIARARPDLVERFPDTLAAAAAKGTAIQDDNLYSFAQPHKQEGIDKI